MDEVIATFIDYVNAGAFPPHATCLLFNSGLLTLTIIGQFLVFLSYMLIPWSLVCAHQRLKPRLPAKVRIAILLFASFIFLCGLTHFSGMANIVFATYWLHAVLLNITAAVSLVTAFFVMWNATSLYREMLRVVSRL